MVQVTKEVLRQFEGTEDTGLFVTPEGENDTGFWQGVGAAWMYDNYARDATWKSWITEDRNIDPNFNPFSGGYLDEYQGWEEHFYSAANQEQADRTKLWIDDFKQRQAAASEAGFFATMVGELLKPEILASAALIPFTGGGSSIGMAVGRTALVEGVAAAGVELGRAEVNPFVSDEERLFNVGAAAIFSGALVGTGKGMARGFSATKLRPKFNEAVEGFEDSAATVAGVTKDTGTSRPKAKSTRIPIRERVENTLGAESRVEIDYVNEGGSHYSSPAVKRYVILSKLAKMREAMLPKSSILAGITDPDRAVVNKAVDEVVARIKKGWNFAKAFDLDPNHPKFGEAMSEAMNSDQFMRLFSYSDPLAPSVVIDRQQLRGMWEEYLKTGDDQWLQGGAQMYPEIKGPKDYGVKFDNYQDFEEFVVRHEIAHASRHEHLVEEGRKYGTDDYVAIENEANELALKDYLDWRKKTESKAEVEYQSALLRNVDNLAKNVFSKKQKWASDFVQQRLSNSPIESFLRRSMTDEARDMIVAMMGDHSLISTARHAGRNLGSSIHQLAKTHEGKALELDYTLTEIWKAQRKDAGEKNFLERAAEAVSRGGQPAERVFEADLAKVGSNKSYEQFTTDVGVAYNMNLPGGSGDPHIDLAVSHVRKFFKQFEDEAQRAGLLDNQNPRFYLRQLRELGEDIDELNRRKTSIERKPGGKKRFKEMMERLEIRERELETAETLSGERMPTAEDFFARTWNENVFRNAPPELKEIIIGKVTNAFLDHPYVMVKQFDSRGGAFYTRVETNPTNARKRAEDWFNRVADNGDDISDYNGAPGELMARSIPLKNSELINIDVNGVKYDLIVTDVNFVAQRYAMKMGARIEVANRFKGKSYQTPAEVFEYRLQRLLDAERAAGAGKKKNFFSESNDSRVDKMERDMRYLLRALNHQNIADQTKMTAQTAKIIRNMTHLSTLGLTGFTQIPEIATMAGVNGFGRVWASLARQFDDTHSEYLKGMTRAQLLRSGTMSDMALGLANVRYGEGIMPSPNHWLTDKTSRWVGHMFNANGMAPLTTSFKLMSGGIAIDRFAHGLTAKFLAGKGRAAKRSAQEVAEDIAFLDRTNWTNAMQERIAKELDRHWNESYDVDGDIFVVDTSRWTDTQAAKEFEAAIATEVETNILVAGLNDKWKVMDGVLHLPETPLTVRLFGSHPRDGKFIAIQNPMISLPFMYMSFGLAANRRILGPLIRNEMAAPLGMMGAGVALAWISHDIKRAAKFQNYTPTTWERLNHALEMSNFIGIVYDHARKTANVTEAIKQDLGMDWMPDLRAPQAKFLDVDNTPYTLLTELGGPVISKTADAVSGGPSDLGRLIPFQQILPMSWMVKGTVNLGEMGVGEEWWTDE